MDATPLSWTPETVQRFWEYWASRPDRHTTYFAYQVGKGVCKFLEHLGPLAGRQVLDYGAGPGYLVEPLLRRGAEVSAIEYSESTVSELNHRFRRERGWHGARTFQQTRLPWDDAAFDLVVCLETIEHLLPDDLNPVLRELLRVVRPGGTIVLTTPNSENLRAQAVFCPNCACEFHRWQHVRRWTEASLCGHLTELSYAVEFCRGLSFHDFQPAPLRARDFLRPKTWRRLAGEISAQMSDRINHRTFPETRAFERKLRSSSGQHLVAVARKPVSDATDRTMQYAGLAVQESTEPRAA
jgi:2-polyprenyl-3-methyl-5-hydroxy-6-metoxy-1,4-benzoquinol methylase